MKQSVSISILKQEINTMSKTQFESIVNPTTVLQYKCHTLESTWPSSELMPKTFQISLSTLNIANNKTKG